MSAYSALMGFVRETTALEQVSERLSWDLETCMPSGAIEQRAEEHAAIEAILHARRTNPKVGEWLADAKPSNDTEAANLRLVQRTFDRYNKVPVELAADLARITSKAHGIWATARAAGDFSAFAGVLGDVIELRRAEANALSDSGNAYDALLNDYEPGTSSAEIAAMFNALRPSLVELRKAVLECPQPVALKGTFDEDKQLFLAQKMAGIFGYDFSRGRIDKAVHPFSSGSGNDVRITTRTAPEDPFNCIYSTIHEVGHACYEQNIDQEHLLTPLGNGVSMGVHESQSRIYENQLGRSRAFTGWLFAQMRDLFGDFGISHEETFYAAVNAVRNGYIRTEADELQYNLHVMLRFDIERALISGDLAVGDLESAWNDRFLADFGFEVDQPQNGVLQDVHWSEGLFGYFPTYTLGNVYAVCLFEALSAAKPQLNDELAEGDLTGATAWLRDNLQQFGGLRSPNETIEYATGSSPNEVPFINYLSTKFKGLYNL